MSEEKIHDWSFRLRQTMAMKDVGVGELGRRTRLSRDNVYKYLQGRVAQPRGDVLERIAKALGVNEQWLRDGVGPQYSTLPVVGYVGAGESFTPYGDLAAGAPLDEIDFDVGAGDPIAVRVRGGSMEPAYRPGDVLVCSRHPAIDAEAFIGRDCVVLLESGEGCVKRVVPGSRPGRFNLLSYAAPPINDATLAWAAPILWVRRAQ